MFLAYNARAFFDRFLKIIVTILKKGDSFGCEFHSRTDQEGGFLRREGSICSTGVKGSLIVALVFIQTRIRTFTQSVKMRFEMAW